MRAYDQDLNKYLMDRGSVKIDVASDSKLIGKHLIILQIEGGYPGNDLWWRCKDFV